MAEVIKHVSDLSGREAEDVSQLGRLVVIEHPAIGEPAELEAFADELEGLEATERLVRLQWTAPGERRPLELTVTQEAFDALAKGGDMKTTLLQAITAGHAKRGVAQATTPRRGGSGRGKVNYATLDHAGEPHRGRITDAEKELVRSNLEQINKSLREKGMREIDPSDPAMKERYGL